MFDINTSTSDYMSIVLIHACQLNCPFCVDTHHTKQIGEKISLENVRKALDFAKRNNIKDILLVGGEPTLHSKIIDIAKMVKDYDFKCVLTTNYQHPDIIKSLDGIVDCFNISYYGQQELPKQCDFKSDLTLSVLLYSGRFTKEEFDIFIDNYKNDIHLKFSTLTICNEWTKTHQKVDWLDELIFEWTGVLFDEILGHIYKGCVIKRYDKIVNHNAAQSYKCHIDGTISKCW